MPVLTRHPPPLRHSDVLVTSSSARSEFLCSGQQAETGSGAERARALQRDPQQPQTLADSMDNVEILKSHLSSKTALEKDSQTDF